MMNGQRTRGLAIQRAALLRSDVFMIFGASEVALDMPFHARDVFRTAPTGFTVLAVGEPGTPEAMTTQNLLALGDALRGHHVAVFLSLEQFIRVPLHLPPKRPGAVRAVRARFSPLHAATALFGDEGDGLMRQRVATQFEELAGLLDNEPLLRLAAHSLVRNTIADRVRYALLRPIGRLMIASLEIQDHINVLDELVRSGGLPPRATRVRAPVDWAHLKRAGEVIARREAAGNPFGFTRRWFAEAILPELESQRGSRPDSVSLGQLSRSGSWKELDLLIGAITAVGAKALIICGPLKGPYADFRGTSPDARRIVYDSVEHFAQVRGVPLLTFRAADEDPWFMGDQSHPSAKGWVGYDEALDAFYAGRR